MKDKFKRIYNNMITRELRVLPANLAYSFTLAIIPILSIVIFILSSFNISTKTLSDFLNATFNDGVVDLLSPIFTSNMSLGSLFTLCFAIIVATGGFNTVIVTSNRIYDLKDAGPLRRFTKALVMAILITILFTFILIVPLFGKSIINVVTNYFPFWSNNSSVISILYRVLQIPVSLVIMFFMIKIIYTMAPDDKIESKYVNGGSLFTAFTWWLVTMIFSYYVNNIARYDLVYGNLANIVILLFYFYILAYIFIFGLCINKENVNSGIEKTNTIKLEEIRQRIKEDMK